MGSTKGATTPAPVPEVGAESLDRDMALRQHDRRFQMIVTSKQIAMESATAAIKALMLINGGAVVTLLAFIGTVEANAGDAVSVGYVITPLVYFAFAAALSVITAALTYVVNLLDANITASVRYSYNHPYILKDPKTSKAEALRYWMHVTAAGIGLGAIACMITGICRVGLAIVRMGI